MRIELTKGVQSVRSVEQGRDNLLYARCVRIAPKPSRRVRMEICESRVRLWWNKEMVTRRFV